MAGYFLRLGTVGFGGPIALVGYMRDDLVERRGWITEEEYREGLALAQLAPGPLAAQLAMYLAWTRCGVAGATLAGIAFIAPSLGMVLALSALYVKYGGIPWIQGVFYGVGAAVIAIVARSAVKLAVTTVGRDRLLGGVFVANALATAWMQSESVALILASGAAALLVRGIPRWWLSVGACVLAPWAPAAAMSVLAGATPTLPQLFWFFAKAGALVFGSGLAVVPFLHSGAVAQLQWLSEREFLDAVAVSMITPGPVVITVAFIGYLLAGVAGALTAAAGVFLPVYLVVVLTAAHFHRVARSPAVRVIVAGITAATTGAIAGATVVLGQRAITDLPTLAIGVGALVAIVRWHVNEPVLLLVAGTLGVALSGPLS